MWKQIWGTEQEWELRSQPQLADVVVGIGDSSIPSWLCSKNEGQQSLSECALQVVGTRKMWISYRPFHERGKEFHRISYYVKIKFLGLVWVSDWTGRETRNALMNPRSQIAPQAFHFLLKQLAGTLTFTEVSKCQRATWKMFFPKASSNSWLQWHRISSVLVNLTLLCPTQLLKGLGYLRGEPPPSACTSKLHKRVYNTHPDFFGGYFCHYQH